MGAPARRRGGEGEAVSADGVAARRLAPRRRDDARRPRPPLAKVLRIVRRWNSGIPRRRGPAVCGAAVPRARLLGPPLPPPAPRRPPRDVARRVYQKWYLTFVDWELREQLEADEARPRGQREGGGAEKKKKSRASLPSARWRRRRRRQPRGGGAQRVARQLAGPRPPREAASVRRAVGLRLQGGVDGRGARHHAHPTPSLAACSSCRRAARPSRCSSPDGTTAAPQLLNSLLSLFRSAAAARRATSA